MKKMMICLIGALVLYSCSKSSIEDVPTPTKKILKVGDTCFGGFVYKKTGDYHGFVVKNTDKSNLWKPAKEGESSIWKLPSCSDLDTIFSVQTRIKISFKISGIYWVDGVYGNKYQVIYEREHIGGPCYAIPESNKIKIAYIRQF